MSVSDSGEVTVVVRVSELGLGFTDLGLANFKISLTKLSHQI